jgi:hypothetical protein
MYPRVVSRAFCRQVARGYCGDPTTRAALSGHCLASLMQVLLHRGWVPRMDGRVEHPQSGTVLAIMIAPGEGEVQVAYMANQHGWLPMDRDSDLLIMLRHGQVSTTYLGSAFGLCARNRPDVALQMSICDKDGLAHCHCQTLQQGIPISSMDFCHRC